MIKYLPHQVEAIQAFPVSNCRKRLLHETGTGKTYSFFGSYLYLSNIAGRPLEACIICPEALIKGNWIPFLIEQGYYEYFHVYSYEYIYRHLELLKDIEFVILDEDHKISEPTSKIAKQIIKTLYIFDIQYRIGGTGTPMPRGYTDLYNSCVLYGGETKSFWKWALKYGKFNQYIHKWFPFPGALRQIIADYPFFHIARLKDVAPDLREPEINQINIDMPAKLRKLYEFEDLDLEEEVEMPEVVKTMRKRQICSDVNYNNNEFYGIKLNSILSLIKDNLVEYPLIIWANFIPELEGLYKELQKLSKNIALWRGGTDKNINIWNAGKIDILVAHPKSVGVGLNLQKCHNMIYHSTDWSLIDFQQSFARIYRLGQTEQIKIYILNYLDTIEQAINKVIAKKDTKQEDLKKIIEESMKGKCSEC